MAQDHLARPQVLNSDTYYENIKLKKKLPLSSQQSLSAAFSQIPASSFPQVPGGKVIEIPADTSVIDAVRILSEHDIAAAPVTNPESGNNVDWRERYAGVIDYSAIIFWVLNSAELTVAALTSESMTTAGAGALGVLGVGAVALGATGPLAAAGLIIAAIAGTLASGLAAESDMLNDDSNATRNSDEKLDKAFLREEPFKSTIVKSIVKSYDRMPFLPVTSDSSMLTVFLLLSKYRMRNVPVIEIGNPLIKNFITQSAVVKGLQQCKGSSWFECIASHPLSDFGLPFVSYDELVSINEDDLILEAFKRMKDNQIRGLPVLLRGERKIVGSASISDIKHLLLRPKLFPDIRHVTTMNFLKTVSSLNAQSEQSMALPVTCLPHASLGSVIEILSSRSVTRVYVVENDDLEILGVVTLRDVISCFVSEPPDQLEIFSQFDMKELPRKVRSAVAYSSSCR